MPSQATPTVLPGAFSQIETAERAIGSVRAQQKLMADLLVKHDGDSTLSADGLYELFESLAARCDQATAALSALRVQLRGQPS